MGFSRLLAGTLLALASASGAARTTPPRPPVQKLAATPQFRHYNIGQGLPSSNVYTVAQSPDGMIWMGTITGLARFDGNHVKVFRHIPGKPSSLASDDVSSVLADRRGRLWAGGENSGVNLYQPDTGGFRHFRHDPHRADSLAGNDVMAMAEGRDGTLWVGTYGHGLDHMTAPGHFRHYTHHADDPHSLVSNNVLALFSRGKGKVWIGTDKGLDILDAAGHLQHVRFAGLEKAPIIWGIDGNAHEVRVDTGAGLYVIGPDGRARPALPRRLHHGGVICSVRDHQGDLWVGANTGLYLVHDGHATYFPPRPLLPGGQPGQLIWKLMVDREGGLWIATQNSGVAYLSPDWRNFSHYAHRPDDDSSLASSHVRSLLADGHGKLWVAGGANQLDKLDPATGKVTHLGKQLGPTPRRILSMAPAGDGALWLGSGSAVALLEHGHMHTVSIPGHPGSYQRMLSDAAGDAYVAATGAGVFRVDRHSLRVEPLRLAFAGGAARQTSDLVMHDGEPWRASHAGLSRLTADGTRFVPVPGVARGQVTAFALAGDNLWLIRPTGLEHYRLNGHRATRLGSIGADGGWPGIVAYSMRIDKRGRVWMFGDAGLWRYDPDTRQFRHYGIQDGLPSPEFTAKQLARAPGGTLFAGTLGGVVGFRPVAIKDHPRKPQLAITALVVRRDGHDVKLPADTRHLHLRWNDQDLRITAQAFSYVAPQRNHYRFRLAGLDTGWVDTGTRGVRELAGLTAGHYRLHVEAAGPGNAWSHLSAPLSIDVDAPPWATPWAWLVYVLVALAVAWLVFTAWRRRLEQRHRLQMVEQKRRMAEQASAAKTRFLATLSHEIRTPMTGVMGMAELLLEARLGQREHGYVQTIRQSGALLLKLINEALDMARIEAGRFTLEPAPLDPRALIDEVRHLQVGQARLQGLSLQARVDDNVPARLVGDATRIQQILLNLSNNALKFTEHGSVTLHAGYTDGHLVLEVADTGPGIAEADRKRLFERFEQADNPHRSEGTGLGLAICRELVALMRGRIELDTAPGKGSRFTVHLPLPETAAGADETTAPVPSDTAMASGLHLLLIEDNATIAEVIRGMMETRGHHVAHAADGLEALGELERGHFDALLMDLNLPGLDGCQLTRMIRQRESDGTHLPVIAITARSGGDEEREAREAGMDAFLRKPVRGEQLVRVLDDLCGAGQQA